MLATLTIHNVAIIHHLRIDFGPGLNVFTGETGAGKSIIMAAFSAVLGERVVTRELIRTGENVARVEAHFNLDVRTIRDRARASRLDSAVRELKGMIDGEGLEWNPEEELIVTRELNVSGRNRCFINDQQVQLGFLKTLGSRLVDLHGQHDHQQLLDLKHQLRLLDGFGGNELIKLRDQVVAKIQELRLLEESIRRLDTTAAEKEAQRELWQFQADEIDGATIDVETDRDVEERFKRMANQERLLQESHAAVDLLTGPEEGSAGILQLLRQLKSRVEGLAEFDSGLSDVTRVIDDTYFSLEDLVDNLGHRFPADAFESQELGQLEQRIGVLTRLRRKYGPEIDDVIRSRETLQQNLDGISGVDQDRKLKARHRVDLLHQISLTAAALSRSRSEAALALQETIRCHLKDLAMPHARFEINTQVTEDEDSPLVVEGRKLKLHGDGIDRVNFLISVNPGEELKPLARIASGGELSRVVLAIKSSQAVLDRVPIMVFDEIDTGIGGTTAVKVGEKLADVSRACQALVITHLPQIASLAEVHFAVGKTENDGRSMVSVSRLDPTERVLEIQRMLGGAEKVGWEDAKRMLRGLCPTRRPIAAGPNPETSTDPGLEESRIEKKMNVRSPKPAKKAQARPAARRRVQPGRPAGKPVGQT